MRRCRIPMAAGLMAALACVVVAQAPKPLAAPADQPVPSGFRSYVIVDNRYAPLVTPVTRPEDRDPRDRTSKMHDFVVEHGLNPVVAIYTRSPTTQQDSQVAKLVKQLDPIIAKNRASNLAAFAVFATLAKEFPFDETRNAGGYVRDEQAQDLIKLATGLGVTKVPFSLTARTSEKLNEWGLGDNDTTVVVLYSRLQVVGKWPTQGGDLSEDDITAILTATDKVATSR